MAASATTQMTADRREVFIESSQFVTSALPTGPAKSRWPAGRHFCRLSRTTPRPDIHRFQTGPLSVNPKSTNDVPTRDGREQAPHLICCSGRFLSCCQGTDRGMVLADRSKAHAKIG